MDLRRSNAATYLQSLSRGYLARRRINQSRYSEGVLARLRAIESRGIGPDALDDYLQPAMLMNDPTRASSWTGSQRMPGTSGDDDVFGTDLRAGTGVGAPLGLVPIGPNTPIGNMTAVETDVGELEENAVPIRNFSVSVRLSPDFNGDMGEVQSHALSFLTQRFPHYFQNREGIYAQVRLLRIVEANMTNDLVTAMVPIEQLMDEFDTSVELYEQSEDTLDPRLPVTIEFRYTAVFPNGMPITPRMVQNTTLAFRRQASHATKTNMADTQARFIAMHNLRNARGARSDSPRAVQAQALRDAIEERRQVKLAVSKNRTVIRRNERAAATQEARVALGLPAIANKKAPKRALTEDQRRRYNQKRRENYHNQKETRGLPYKELKKRIFHHSSLEHFYEHSKAVLVVPNTEEEGLCLAMALLRSEQRLYDIQDLEIFEQAAEPVGSRVFRTFPFSDRFKGLLQHSAHYSFLSVNDEGEYEGCLFNPYKPFRKTEEDERGPDGILKYCLNLSEQEVQSWYITAQAFVEYISYSIKDMYGEDSEIDPNREESFLQAVSDVLDVHIGVYRASVQGKRCNVYKPHSRNIDIRKNSRRMFMVNILITEEHASSITNLREMVKNRSSANRMHIQNYCLICEKVTTANNCNIEACKKHFLACMEKYDGEVTTHSETHHKKEYIKTYNPVQFFYRAKFKDFVCRTCRGSLEHGQSQTDHVCYIVKPEKLDEVDRDDIVVYDFEAAQIEIEGTGMKRHEVNLACCRNAYSDPVNGDDRRFFLTIEGFMEWIMSQTTKRRVYIAHNAGSYDVQFVMRYLEKNLIPHSFIPAPSSIHKYLSVTIPFGAGYSATFLDFRNFMPGSLKSIGQSFGLPISKGDFPHHFNNGWRDLYEGRIPVIDHEDDYWCLSSKRSEGEVAEFITWYDNQCITFCTCDTEACTCGKLPWNFQTQLLHYCWLDVDVLAEAVQRYRDNAMSFATISSKEDNCGWEPKNIDPYAHLTIAQMAMKLLLSGLPEPEMITITPNKVRTERCQTAIAWMERICRVERIHIRHIGNSNTEFFCMATNRFLDGYCKESHRVYVCLNCDFHGCPNCFYEEIQTGTDHPARPGTYGAVFNDTKQFLDNLYKAYGLEFVEVCWECQNDNLSAYEIELGDIMKERDCFYGGRTEVFSPYTHADPAEGRQIKYKDVCSLYPFVCARKMLPTGVPQHICGAHIEKERLLPNHPDRYFGFVKCQIIPNKQDILGLLPRRDAKTGRLEFPLEPWIGNFGTEELDLAIRNGYEVGDVYEVFHWTNEERSDTLLRGYISFFLRMKQESEGWVKLGGSSENPSEEEKDRLIEMVYKQNGDIARIRKEQMQKNPTRRQLAKIFLNSLWGKFCQKPHKEHFSTIHGYSQFVKLWFDPTIERKTFSFRHISGNTWKVRYCTVDSYVKPNPKYNIFLAAKVTEWARTILHTEMLRVGPSNVLYCDTDSIMYECSVNEVLDGHGLGEWVDEYPNERIVKLYALAPKFYFLLKENGESLLKSKGVQLTLKNSKKINEERLKAQILELLYATYDESGERDAFRSYIEVDNMIMGVNSTNASLEYGCMLTRYTNPKKVRPVISKRVVLTIEGKTREEVPITLAAIRRVFTIPKGFHEDAKTLAAQIYS